MRALPARLALVAALLAGAAAGATAQFQRGFFGARLAQPGDFDGQFHFCRLVYSGSRRGSGGREYLLKGGFPWANDDRYPNVDVPLTHPLLRAQFVIAEIPQIPNIGYYLRSGGDTSEQGADSETPHARVIADDHGRVMVLMTHNTDISDSWEREADDPGYFYTFSPRGYAFGINVLRYARVLRPELDT